VIQSDGAVFRFAGGAPIYVSAWSNLGFASPQPTTMVDSYSLAHTATTGPLSHILYYPADGAILRAGPNRFLYAVFSGIPSPTVSSSTAVVVDPAAIANAAAGGYWNHLK
jgi:hypothetical protein